MESVDMDKVVDRQACSGIFTIPDGWFVVNVDFDADEPYCTIHSTVNYESNEVQKILIPKSLAYFLSTHFCGSAKMHKLIEDNTRSSIKNTIKSALRWT